MNTVIAITQHKNAFCYAIIISSIILGALVSIFFDNNIALSLTIIFFSLTIPLFLKPTWLFYFFMLFFVFGEVSIGQFVIDASLSNGFTILAICIIIAYGLYKKRFYGLLQTQQQKNLFLGLFVIFIVELLSAILNNSFRSLATRLSHVITLLFILVIVHNKVTLWRGFYLGMISVSILSLMTILAGFNLNPIGYRAPISWGSTPWEDYIHRSIGLYNMRGGLHSIYILTFLPLAILLVISGNKLKINHWIKIISAFIAILGILALLIASYRSGWLGLVVSLFCLILFYYKFNRISTRSKLFILIIACILILILFPFGKSFYDNIYNLVFNVRSQGVEARLIQYRFIIDRIFYPSINLIFGFGSDSFDSMYANYIAEEGLTNPELFSWIHNYYFGILFSSGWLGLITFLFLIYSFLKNLYSQAASDNYSNMVLNSAIFASLSGILVVLFFTAVTSGLHIVIILIAASAIVNKNEPNFLIELE